MKNKQPTLIIYLVDINKTLEIDHECLQTHQQCFTKIANLLVLSLMNNRIVSNEQNLHLPPFLYLKCSEFVLTSFNNTIFKVLFIQLQFIVFAVLVACSRL